MLLEGNKPSCYVLISCRNHVLSFILRFGFSSFCRYSFLFYPIICHMFKVQIYLIVLYFNPFADVVFLGVCVYLSVKVIRNQSMFSSFLSAHTNQCLPVSHNNQGKHLCRYKNFGLALGKCSSVWVKLFVLSLCYKLSLRIYENITCIVHWSK